MVPPKAGPVSFKRLLGRMPFVFVCLENLAQTIETDPVPLLKCKRMICRLKFDGWPRWIRSQLDMGLEVERVRVSWKLLENQPKYGASSRRSVLSNSSR